jgi:hypothetical protein
MVLPCVSRLYTFVIIYYLSSPFAIILEPVMYNWVWHQAALVSFKDEIIILHA